MTPQTRVSIVVCSMAVFLMAPAGSTSISLAQSSSTRAAADPSGVRTSKAGEYAGLTLGIPQKYRKKRRMPRKPTLYWVGFVPRQGKFFFQLTHEPTYTQTVHESSLYVTLEGVRYGYRNSRRRLDTRFFTTAVRLMTSRRVRGKRASRGRPKQPSGIRLKFQFKNPEEAKQAVVSVQQQDGYYFLSLGFDQARVPEAAPEADDSSDDGS